MSHLKHSNHDNQKLKLETWQVNAELITLQSIDICSDLKLTDQKISEADKETSLTGLSFFQKIMFDRKRTN